MKTLVLLATLTALLLWTGQALGGAAGGVIAHELAHVRNRDTLVMTVAATLGGAVSMLANVAQWGLLLGGARSSADSEEGSRDPLAGLAGVIVAPFAAMLIQMAVCRSREFVADETAARVTGDPMALAAALRKLDAWSRQTPMAAASPATAHLFIVNPFAGSGLLRLFSTHPSTDARVARLEALASRGSFERAPARDAWAQREKENRP